MYIKWTVENLAFFSTVYPQRQVVLINSLTSNKNCAPTKVQLLEHGTEVRDQVSIGLAPQRHNYLLLSVRTRAENNMKPCLAPRVKPGYRWLAKKQHNQDNIGPCVATSSGIQVHHPACQGQQTATLTAISLSWARPPWGRTYQKTWSHTCLDLSLCSGMHPPSLLPGWCPHSWAASLFWGP